MTLFLWAFAYALAAFIAWILLLALSIGALALLVWVAIIFRRLNHAHFSRNPWP